MSTVDLILESWGLEDLIPIFIENEIDVEALTNLTEDMVKELIPKVGPRAKFLKKLNEYKGILNNSNVDQEQVRNVESESETHQSVLPITEPPLPTSSFHSPSPSTSFERVPDAAKEILDSCLTTLSGKSILEAYRKTNSLNEKLRKLLVHLVIDSALQKNFSIQGKFFEELSAGIQELFPTEKKEVYYIPGSKKCIAKGKLIDRYRNKRRSLTNCGLLPKKLKLNDTTQTSRELESDEANSKDNPQSALKSALTRVTDWDEIVKLWEKTFTLRRKDCKNLKGVENIIENWPPLKQPLGYKLIDFDYKQSFPESSSIFIEWDSFENKIIKTLKDSVRDETAKEIIQTYESPDTNAESKALAVLLLLSYVCKPSIIRLKNKKTWKPTCIESQQSFVYFIRIMGDIEKTIEERRERALKYGLTLQPFVIVVGPDVQNITACFIYINSIRYKVDSVLLAMDICFKSFFVFDIEYPKESRQLWSLLQQSVYKLPASETQAYQSQVAALL